MNRNMNVGNFEQFLTGLRVLVVDDDPTCLVILEKMLRTCHYQVTTSNHAEKALSLLRENRKGYDIIISDVHMPDMDGFKLLEDVGLEMDLPVIMISGDDSKSVVMKGITHGACDYLIKPVRMEALKTIWQHVVRRKQNEWKELEQSRSMREGEQQQKPNEGVGSSANGGNLRNSKRKNEEDNEAENKEGSVYYKKPRVVWSVELHQQFMAAVDQLGVDKAVPKKILETMNVPGLTRENVASHLQKFRLYLGRLSGGSQHHPDLGKYFMRHRDAAFRSMSSINGLNLQAPAATGHLPAQSLANLQAATLSRSFPKSSISTPILNQRNSIFSFENPSKLRIGDNSFNSVNNSNQVNLLHGIPMTMKPKQLANFRGMSMQQNPHGRDSSPLMNNSHDPHLSRISSSAPISRKSVFSTNGGFVHNELFSSVRASGFGHNEVVSNVRASGYNPLTQPSPMVGFSSSVSNMRKGLLSNEGASKESQGFESGYDIFNDLAQHKTTSIWDLQNVGLGNMGKGLLQNDGISKESQAFESGYDIFNDLTQNKTTSISDLPNVGLSNMGKGLLQNEGTSKESQVFVSGYDIFDNPAQHNTTNSWEFQNVGLSFESTPHVNVQGNANNLNAQPSVLANQGFSSGQDGARNRNGNGFGNLNMGMGQQFSTYMGENSLRVESELVPEVSSQNPLFSEQHGQEDILSELLKQQQEGIGPLPDDFGLDDFPPLDDFPL